MHLIHPRRTLAAFLAACLLIAGALTSGPAYAAVPTTPFVSEIHYDNDGADVDEFVEVQLPPGTTSSGLTVCSQRLGGASYATLPCLRSPRRRAHRRWWPWPRPVCNGGPDGLALVDGSTVLDRFSYEGSFTAADGAAAGQTLPDIGVAEQVRSRSASRSPASTTGDRRVRLAGCGRGHRGTLNPELTPATTCDETPTHGSARSRDPGPRPAGGRGGHVRGVVVGDVPGWRLLPPGRRR